MLHNQQHASNASGGRPIGIIAGWGRYPELVAENLKRQGHPVVVAGIAEHAGENIRQWCDDFSLFGIGKFGKQQAFLKRHGVRQVVLAGKIFKHRILYEGIGWIGQLPDVTCLRTIFHHLISHKKSARDDSLLLAVVASFERQGMKIVPGTQLVPSLLAEIGVLTRIRPTKRVTQDIVYGWRVAKQSGLLDIGQSVTVRDQTVLAIEAIEGTDACIDRTAKLCPRGGFTLVKVAKPKQDNRFDLPTIGPQTIDQVKKAGGAAIAIEAHKTILIDREEVLRAANRLGIAIVSIESENAAERAAA